jgi:energy-coupling factor transporter ATP-binding protein EcfA2
VIEVQGLTTRYGAHVAADDVGFAVTEGEIFGILGVNGAGKTTTVDCPQGLRRPNRGYTTNPTSSTSSLGLCGGSGVIAHQRRRWSAWSPSPCPTCSSRSRSEGDMTGRLTGSQAATLALLAFAMLIVSLDQYIVVVALPEIGRDLGFSEQTLQAVISAYAVTSAGFLLLGGRAADLLGRRRILVCGLGLYAGASLAGGLAPASVFLLIARAAQGLGGALVFPATLSLVNTSFAEGSERNRALAVWGSAGAAGLVLGVLHGGVLTQALGWEAVFFVNVPLAAVTVLLAFRLIPPTANPETNRSFDLPGALSATLLTLSGPSCSGSAHPAEPPNVLR